MDKKVSDLADYIATKTKDAKDTIKELRETSQKLREYIKDLEKIANDLEQKANDYEEETKKTRRANNPPNEPSKKMDETIIKGYKD